MEFSVRRATTAAEREEAFAVRRAVFVDEQGVAEDLEFDDHDETATHFVAYDDEQAIGAARLRVPEPGMGKAERVAVLEAFRGADVGRALMRALEAAARERGFERMKLHAQVRVQEFYERLGYERVSDVFEEAGIEHVEMDKEL
jgi:predicted GNAT family N-acyltransferase